MSTRTETGPPDRVVHTSRRGLTYGLRGEGPAVLLVHGWCLDRTVWMYLEGSLVAAGHQVITPALAGYGASADLAGPYTLDRHGDDLVDLLAELGLSDVTVVGFAFGAAVLFRLPSYDAVRSMVFVGVPSAAAAPYPKMRTAMIKDWPLFAQRSARAICNGGHSEATYAWLGGVFAATPLASALAGVDVLAEFEPARETQRWQAPSWFVHGRQDTVVPLEVSEQCVSRFTGAELVPVENSGHFVVLDQRQALHDAVLRATSAPARSR